MIFIHLRFIALFLACWVCFFVLPRHWRTATLAFWGGAFYLMYAGTFLAVVLALAVLVLFSNRRAIAPIAVVVVIALLVYFKLRVTAPTGVISVTVPPSGTVIIPLGLSYLSFELLHVIIERRLGRIDALSFPDLLAFVFFAPARVAGPIKRYPDFITSVRKATLSSEHVYAGLIRVIVGLAKKFFIADILALTVVEQTYVASLRQAWMIVLAYTFQIYFDFSAYTDIAIGFARMLGITLPENFRWPYLAPNIREFWNRWHITLSSWVRDYVFVPTGRQLFATRLRSSPIAIATVSYLLTFLTVGAWHGLTVGFLIWGLYHGLLLSAHHAIQAKAPIWMTSHPLYRSRFINAASTAVTFLFVVVGWVPFMTTWPTASKLLTLMFLVQR